MQAEGKVLDKHATLKKFSIIKETNLMVHIRYKIEKLAKRKLEKKWKQTRCKDDYEACKNQGNKFNTLLNKLRTDQISHIISENRNNSHHQFKSLNSVLHRNVSLPLPPHDLSNFFEEKIDCTLLKKINLQLVNKNCRPESNLLFLGKDLEACVIKQYLEHLAINSPHTRYFTALKHFYSKSMTAL